MSGWQPWLSSHSLSPQGKVCSSPSFWSAWYSADENYFTPLCCLPLLYLFLPSIRRQSLRSGIMKWHHNCFIHLEPLELPHAVLANAQVLTVPCRVQCTFYRSTSTTSSITGSTLRCFPCEQYILQNTIHPTLNAYLLSLLGCWSLPHIHSQPAPEKGTIFHIID